MTSPSSVIKMDRGDDFTFDVFVVDNVTGLPRDITGTSFWFTAKASFYDDDDDALITKDSTTGIAILDGPGGQARVFIDAADTEEFEKEMRLRFDVQWKDDNDAVKTVSKGDLVVELDVTRRTA